MSQPILSWPLQRLPDFCPILTPSPWWRHQMEAFSALLAICAGNSPVPGEFPTQRPVTRSFVFSLICVWINGWVNNREAGDLRCYRAHYDVTVMFASDWYRAHLLVWDLQVSSDDLASWVTVPDVVMWCSRTCFAIHAVLLLRNEPAINLTSILYIIRWYVSNASFAHLQMKRIHMYNDVQNVLSHPISNNVGTYLKSSRKNVGYFGWTL